MRTFIAVVLLVAAIIVRLGYQQYLHITTPGKLPDFELNTYWGRGEVDKNKDNNSTILQEIQYSLEPIDELQKLLGGDLGLVKPLEGVNFEYGVNSEWLAEFVAYWRDEYLENWLVRELEFNRVPHYTTYIQGYFYILKNIQRF